MARKYLPLSGGGQGDEAQLVDDEQAEAGHLPLQVEQPSLVPGPSGPLYLVFTGTTRQRGSPAGVLLHHGAAGPPGLPHDRGVRRDGPGQPAVLAGNSPVYGRWLECPPFVAERVAGKPVFILSGRKLYFCPFQPGVHRDDAQLSSRSGGQRELYEWFFDRSCSCGSGFDVDVALTAATRLPDKITFSVQVC